MTVAVCDSGPLTHLWQIDAWHTLGVFETIHVAAQVRREIQRHVPLERLETIAGCQLQIHEVSLPEAGSRAALFPELLLQEADLATLALAVRLKPDLILTDDLAMRRAVEAQQQTPMGSVGILLCAYKAGRLDINGLEHALDRLFVHSTLYLSPRFKSYVQRLIAEMIR